MITWTEEDKVRLRDWLGKGLGRKMMEYLKQSLPSIDAENTEHFALLAAKKEGRWEQIRLLETEMSTPIENQGVFAAHVDMSRD